MKIYHFVLLFIIFFAVIIIKTDFRTGELKDLKNEKAKLTTSLNTAVSDAINCLASSGTHGLNSINKDEVSNTFFSSLFSSLGIISDVNAQAEIELYIPVMLLCDSDGYYVYYFDEYIGADGYAYSKRIWSEKQPYYYTDDNFIYTFTLLDIVSLYDKKGLLVEGGGKVTLDYHELKTEELYAAFRQKFSDSFMLNNEEFKHARKEAIINRLEEVLAYYTSRHNAIASRNGITYTFSFPDGQEEEWAAYLNDVSLLVVFQGYPYGKNNDYTYNKIASAGANIIKKPQYYVEQKSWYCLAHIAGCEKLDESSSVQGVTVLEETFDTLEECARLGAYCCECIEHGPRVPDID